MAGLTVPAALGPPEALREDHETEGFDSGEPTLNTWLVRRARANQTSGASRTYVVCRERKVVGYYALASGGIDLDAAPGRLRRNMPDPLPVVVLGRLAIAQGEQGQGLGHAMLRDASMRVLQAAERVGVALLVVHALSDRAKQFYLGCGFKESPLDPMTLMVRVKDLGDARGQ